MKPNSLYVIYAIAVTLSFGLYAYDKERHKCDHAMCRVAVERGFEDSVLLSEYQETLFFLIDNDTATFNKFTQAMELVSDNK